MNRIVRRRIGIAASLGVFAASVFGASVGRAQFRQEPGRSIGTIMKPPRAVDLTCTLIKFRAKRMVSLLDIIGPVMVGPSSSHTAGACRLGLLARGLVGGTPDRAMIELHGSFARTGEGHGTDKAIVAGLMGFRPDDDRIRTALEIAEREGLNYTFDKTTLDEEAHPNSVRITLERGDRKAIMIGSSLGAGRVLVSEIDGFPVEVSGHYHTIVLVAEDVPGSIAKIATLLADDGLNIATLKLTRQRKGGDAFMVIELDEYPAETVRDHIRALPWVRWAFRLDKVSS